MKNHLIDALSKARKGAIESQHPVMICPDSATLSYQQFFDDVYRTSQLFVQYNLDPDFRVAVLAKKSISVIVAYLGAVSAGGVFVPINPAYTDNEVEYFIRDVEPSILITEPERVDSLTPLASSTGVHHLLTMDDGGGGTFRDSWQDVLPGAAIPRKPEDLAAILYTSGTTGKPKGAMLSHAALASNSDRIAKLWRFSSEDRLLHALPIHHTHGLFVATNVALLSGASLIFLSKFDANLVLHHMARATAFMGVPTFYKRLLELPTLDATSTQHMRLFVSGSAPLDAKTYEDWKRRTGHEILERYGMTEANMICSIPFEGPRKPGSVGKPLPGVEVRIRDTVSGELASAGQTGMLEVHSSGLFSGYWRQPKKSEAEFTDDGYLVTGDLARIDRDGFTMIEGRAKDLVISGGINLYPKEIEDAINQVSGIVESAVIGVPHPDLGECAIAIVVAKEDTDLNPETITEYLNAQLARFKHPRHFEFVPSLPRNAMGKVQKSILRNNHVNLFRD